MSNNPYCATSMCNYTRYAGFYRNILRIVKQTAPAAGGGSFFVNSEYLPRRRPPSQQKETPSFPKETPEFVFGQLTLA